MAIPTQIINFNVTRNANYSNYIDFVSNTGSPSFTMGPNAGNQTLNLPQGVSYTLSGRSTGIDGNQSIPVLWTILSPTTIGLEDDLSELSDYDYDDLMVYASAGTFTIAGPNILFNTPLPSDPTITSFTATPNPQTSGTVGIPSSSTKFSWVATNAVSYSINQGVGAVSTSPTVDTGLQSVAGSNSPATKDYILTACNDLSSLLIYENVCVTETLTVSVYNDNTPNNYTIPSTATRADGSSTTAVSITNLEPNVSYIIDIGAITGIDMITRVDVGGDAGIDCSTNNGFFSSSNVISNGQNLKIRVNTKPFNSTVGTNVGNYYVIVGTVRKDFQFITRGPNTAELFDFANELNRVPYPQLNTTTEVALPYIETTPWPAGSPTTITAVDDVEMNVELKTNNPNAQFKIKKPGQDFGAWVNVRQI